MVRVGNCMIARVVRCHSMHKRTDMMFRCPQCQLSNAYEVHCRMQRSVKDFAEKSERPRHSNLRTFQAKLDFHHLSSPLFVSSCPDHSAHACQLPMRCCMRSGLLFTAQRPPWAVPRVTSDRREDVVNQHVGVNTASFRLCFET